MHCRKTGKVELGRLDVLFSFIPYMWKGSKAWSLLFQEYLRILVPLSTWSGFVKKKNKGKLRAGPVTQTCNSSWLGGSQFKTKPGKKLVRLHPSPLPCQPTNRVWWCSCNPSYMGSIGRKSSLRPALGKNTRHYRKIKQKRNGAVAQMVEHVPS
jgi:hypothetical protein